MNMPFLTMQALLGTDKRPPELPADDSEPGRLTQAIAATRDSSENAEALRLLRAAGVQAVIAPLNRSSHVTPAAAKAAAGAEESVPVVYVVNLASAIAELRDAGVMVVGTAGETDRSIYDFDQKRAFAWVLGAEGEGLRQLTRKRCDALAAIPMMGSVQSLNVSVAAGVCLFQSVRQRVGEKAARVDNPSRAKF